MVIIKMNWVFLSIFGVLFCVCDKVFFEILWQCIFLNILDTWLLSILQISNRYILILDLKMSICSRPTINVGQMKRSLWRGGHYSMTNMSILLFLPFEFIFKFWHSLTLDPETVGWTTRSPWTLLYYGMSTVHTLLLEH